MIKDSLQIKKKYLIMHVIIKNHAIMQLDKKSDVELCSANLAILMTFIYSRRGSTSHQITSEISQTTK